MANTLNDYTKDELLAYAEEFGVEVKPSMNKTAIIAEFEQDGVTAELIQGLHPADEDEVEDTTPEPVAEILPVKDEDEDLVLVKMTRRNHSYEVRGYRFTREHPFALVSEHDADFLIEHGGFAMASPKEARAYYS